MDGKCGQHEVDNLGGTAQLRGDRPDSQRALSPPEPNDEISLHGYGATHTQATRSSDQFHYEPTVTCSPLA